MGEQDADRRPVEAPIRLQNGEDPGSEIIADAVHWFTVYSALLEAAVASNLTDKAEEFSARREFWRRRWTDLRDRPARG